MCLATDESVLLLQSFIEKKGQKRDTFGEIFLIRLAANRSTKPTEFKEERKDMGGLCREKTTVLSLKRNFEKTGG